MTDALSPSQNLFLWALAAKGGEASPKELRPALQAAERRALSDRGLVAAARRGRSVQLRLTESGWARIGAHPKLALPVRGTAAVHVLAQMIERVCDYAKSRGLPVAEIVGHIPAPATSVPATSADLAARIRDAHAALASGGSGRQVRLAALRERLADVPRGELDRALLTMIGDRTGDLLRLDDPTRIGDADRDAALAVGGQARHLLWID